MQSLRLQKKQWTSSVQQEKLNNHYFEAGDFACLFLIRPINIHWLSGGYLFEQNNTIKEQYYHM